MYIHKSKSSLAKNQALNRNYNIRSLVEVEARPLPLNACIGFTTNVATYISAAFFCASQQSRPLAYSDSGAPAKCGSLKIALLLRGCVACSGETAMLGE